MNKVLNVAIVGVGTIGTGVADILHKGIDGVKLYALCDKNINHLKSLNYNDVLIFNNFKEIIKSKKIDIVVEAVGGEYPAYNLIKEALEKGKSVVTANKEVVAKHYKDLSVILKKAKGNFLFEASVGGCVPIINSLYNYKKANEIRKIEGIINGSTNYVLTLMQKDKVPYDDAIKSAKEKGFLESDPSADLKGLDMKRKIAILSDIAYSTYVDIEDIYSYSLENVTDEFINEVKNMGYVLKYMSESILSSDISIRIEPVIVRKNDFLACVDYERNYIASFGDTQEKLEFLGLGAGRYPTSTAIVADILMIRDGQPKMKLDYENVINIDNSSLIDSYLVDGKLDKNLIDHYQGKYIVTKKISWKEIKNNLDKINFYARIR